MLNKAIFETLKKTESKEIITQADSEAKSIMKSFKLQKQPPELFYEKGVLKNFANFKRKYLCQSVFFNKFAGLFWSRFSITMQADLQFY